MTYSISDIDALIGAQRIGTAETHIDWLLTDSRSLVFPEETLFFAIRTQKNDGHRYIPELYKRGVRAFVVAQPPQEPEADANYLVVPSPLKALQRLAERHRERIAPSCREMPIVGVTGSNGKTIVKEWLYQLLSPQMTITRSPRSWNSQIGVPLSVWRLSERTELGIFEAGISEPGEMDALEAIIQPSIGVLTHLGSAHGSRREKCMEKLRLFRHARVLIYNGSDDVVAECVHACGFTGQLIDSASVDVTPFLPPHSGDAGCGYVDSEMRNIATCVAVCRYLGMADDVIRERVARLEPVALRLEVKEGRDGTTLITDTCNSDLDSLEIALDFMRRRHEAASRRRILILSDIKQTGLTLTELYARVAELVTSYGVDEFIGIGQEISAGMANSQLSTLRSQLSFPSLDAFLASTSFATLREGVILIKGARAAHFDRLVDALQQRVHQTTLEVNLTALVDNLNYYRSFMQPQTKMICMVKASAYGAGAVEVARMLQEHRVDYLAVAVADEGVELRRAGITSNIMVMNPEMGTFRTLFDYNLEPEIYSFRLLDALLHDARREGITNFPIHLKLDTGMHRLGFDPEHDLPQLIARLHEQNALLPRSVFTHFVGSDSPDFDAFTDRQWQRFTLAADTLQQAFPYHILRHICNSAAIPRFPERHCDMVRLGLGLYGIDPEAGGAAALTPISTLKTTILQIHDVPAGDTVGYRRRGHVDRPSRIAALPIGYADGLNRHLGCGRGFCLVAGQRAPYVGNICMDVCMIDVTDIPCQEGDTVVIFGPQLPPTYLAQVIDTIPYEILTAVSPRVRRHYFVD